MKTITYNEQTHRLVPIEPTIEMVMARIKYSKESPYKYHETTIEGQYHAMLSAAPQPEPVEVEPYLYEWILRRNGFTQHTKKLTDIADLSQWDILPLYTAPPDYEAVKKQRDELAKALEWSLGNINCEPFEWTCEEDADAHRSAVESLESVKGETK